jgi:CO/xanthine dehydrogenase FAD-binding subunit
VGRQKGRKPLKQIRRFTTVSWEPGVRRENALKPAAFAYHRPSTVDAAVQLMREYGGNAKYLAGGQSLVPMMNMRLVQPAALIDLNAVRELAYLRETEGWLHIGALTRHQQLESDPLVRAKAPLLAEAERFVAHTAIRTRGTIGGSLAHADPAAELPLAAVVLDAVLVLKGPEGTREVPAREFFLTYLTTAKADDELITEVRVPVLAPGTGVAVEEFSRRHGDFAIVAAMAVVELDQLGRVRRARMGLGGVGGTPVRLSDQEEALRGQPATREAFQAAAEAAAAAIAPDSDLHASAEYRRALARTLMARALAGAAARAQAPAERG